MGEEEISDSETVSLDTTVERRAVRDRRRLSLRTFLQSGLTPRRRDGRRDGEHEHLIDWHEPDLLFLALAILLLSITDAFFTLTLMTRGAEEANPVLAYVLQRYPQYFAALKMVLTGGGVLVMVAMARARVFRVMRVRTVLQCFLAGYVVLVGYEMWMLKIVL